MSVVIESQKLTRDYGKQRGISDLDFTVEAGEVFGFLGPNGAGKTTTIRTILDFMRPTSGAITVFGLDSRRDSVAIHRRIGYLPGELALYDRLTGDEILRYFGGLRGGVDDEAIDVLCERLSFDRSRPTGTLSSGNKRKLGLIQAFMHAPELLVLDEPTSGLDPLIQHEFEEMVNEVSAQGCTVFISSHDLAEVERLCDRVAFIGDGRLIAVEDVAALKGKALRKLEIVFAEPVPATAFAGLAGAADVRVSASADSRVGASGGEGGEASGEGTSITLTVTGPLDAVIKRAASFTVADIISLQPSLEDIFMTYYGVDGAEHAEPHDPTSPQSPAMKRDGPQEASDAR